MTVVKARVASRGHGVTHMRWWIAIMTFLGTSINYIDRANLGVALPFMAHELHLNHFQLGLILRAFFWTYAVFQRISGYLVNRVGPRIMYSFAVVWWSASTAATASAAFGTSPPTPPVSSFRPSWEWS